MKTIDGLELEVGDKWNQYRVVIEVDPTYVITAELFKNGKPKTSTALIHGENGRYQKCWIPKK